MPSAEPHQIDSNKHLITDAIEEWKTELEKSQLNLMNSIMNRSQSVEKSQILESHKIIPAYVSSMVPFGKN